MPVTQETRTERLAMVIDLTRCIGCHGCSVACKSEFDVPLGVWRSWVKYSQKGTYPRVKRFFLPRLCNHCEEAPCLRVCPVNATYRKDDGTILIDEDRCIGCRFCIAACPYNARFVHPEKGIVNKCDFCEHRVEAGLVPACVNTCIARARIFGDLNDPESEISRVVSSNPVQVLKPEVGTKPQIYYIAPDLSNTFGHVDVVEGGEG